VRRCFINAGARAPRLGPSLSLSLSLLTDDGLFIVVEHFSGGRARIPTPAGEKERELAASRKAGGMLSGSHSHPRSQCVYGMAAAPDVTALCFAPQPLIARKPR